jgi:dTDP-glucose pyrophosphorylase/predicted transcriptional regulator
MKQLNMDKLVKQMNDIKKHTILNNAIIRDVIKKMDSGGIGIIAVLDKNDNVAGIITDGDFRRSILKGISLNDTANTIMNMDYIFVSPDYSNDEISNIFQTTNIKHIPILKNGELVDILTEDHFYGINQQQQTQFDNPVVIMAGGKGTRLDPFTRILPKPLIPIGDKTILEIIIDKFLPYGAKDFYLTVNYKSIIIKSYFEELKPDYNVHFVDESKPLGTAGSLKYLEGKYSEPIFVTNCDIIIDADYADILRHHIEQTNDITMVASLKHYNIPYGICEIENGGVLKEIKEKPEYSFLVNTGMYILEPSVLPQIPFEELFHITHLMEKIRSNGGKVGVYPVSEKSWIDIGQWREFNEYRMIMKHAIE